MSDRHCRLRRHDQSPAGNVLGENNCGRVGGAQRQMYLSHGRPYWSGTPSMRSRTFSLEVCNGNWDVEWFNAAKGYGFIQPEDGGADVFVHISEVEKVGYTNLAEGLRVSYELMADRAGKMSAENSAHQLIDLP